MVEFCPLRCHNQQDIGRSYVSKPSINRIKVQPMPILGAHMSIAGGYYKSIDRGAEAGCQCIQLFTKNNNQWRAKDITDEDIQRFHQQCRQHNIQHTLSHASYLINLGSPKDELWEKSIAAFVIELQRAEMLGVPYVVVHPGSYTTSTPEQGIERIARALDKVHQQTADLATQCLLETTAGQGSNMGWQLEELACMLNQCGQPEKVGICVDTCHMFAAGYDLRDPVQYEATWSKFDRLMGLHKLKAFHLNDSKREFGSRKDRHEHIGEGEMGLEPFRLIVNDPRFQEIPMYLETAKDDRPVSREGLSWDQINLSTLRSLIE
ncbi:MAG: deoxyribonuclease IV [Planctomycetota bacterium]|nr:deoxyribonuclease IV [Planctomycetota bacterium]